MNPKISEVRSGIDWLTLTVPSDITMGEMWAENCAKVLDMIAEQGYDLQSRTMQGYYGVSAGNCFVGWRDDGWICQLTGYHANDHYEKVWRDYCHVPRIDAQMSVQFEVMPINLGREAYRDTNDANQLLSASRRRKLIEVSGSDNGYTLYIGAPSSAQRGRIYNKEVQSQSVEYERTWRYEVMLRNELAYQFAQDCPRPITPRTQYVQAFVCSWFRRRGVSFSGISSDIQPTLPIRRTLPTDIERQLRWLNTQVKPTLSRLLASGYRDIVLESLGLTEASISPHLLED